MLKPWVKNTATILVIIIAIIVAVNFFFHPDWGRLWGKVKVQTTQTGGNPPPVPNTGSYQVVVVFDGDTIAVSKDNKTQIVQVLGINAPEAGNGGQPIECYAAESAKAASDLLLNKTIDLKADAGISGEDAYGRLLRYIILPDGRVYNQTMLEAGEAYEYTFSLSQPYQSRYEFQQVEASARASKRGLWADNACGGGQTSSQSNGGNTGATAQTPITINGGNSSSATPPGRP